MLKVLIPRVVVFTNDQPSAERRIDFAVFLISYGLIVEKYTLICTMEIQKIHSCLFRICFICGTTNVSVSQSWISLLNCWPRTMCRLIYQQTSANQNTVHLTNGFIWKFSWEWLLWTGCATGGSLRKKSPSPLCSIKNIASLFKEFL